MTRQTSTTVLPSEISCSAVLSLRKICSAMCMVRFMPKSPVQSGRLRTLIQPGPTFGGQVTLNCGGESTYSSHAKKHGRLSDLRPAQGNLAAGQRPNQGRQRLLRFLLRGLQKVDAEWHLISRDTQSAQVVQIQAIGAAGAVIGARMKSPGGDGH